MEQPEQTSSPAAQPLPQAEPSPEPQIPSIPPNTPIFPAEESKTPAQRADFTAPMLTLKAFLEQQSADIDLAEAKRAYFQYREDYEKRFTETFYNDHQADPWFLEKYDPRLVQESTLSRIKSVQIRHKEFISAFQDKAFTGILLRDSTEIVPGPPLFAFDPASLTLFLGLIPTCVWRKEVYNAVHAVPGFQSLSVSEAIPSQGFSRFAWAKFDSQIHCDEACKLLNKVQINANCSISPTPSLQSTRKSLKTQPPQSLPGLFSDYKHLTSLIIHLDTLHQIAQNQLLISEICFTALEEAGKEEQVDLQLLYLRRVYGVCYYCAEVCEDERELSAKCGLVHLRSKVIGMQESKGSLTEKRLEDVYKKAQLGVYDPNSDSALANLISEVCVSLSVTETAPRVRCENCKKLFFDQKYLRKHIESKHSDLIDSVKKTHYDKLTLERFQQDPGKFSYMQMERVAVKRQREEAFEDLDDPVKRPKARKVVSYTDI